MILESFYCDFTMLLIEALIHAIPGLGGGGGGTVLLYIKERLYSVGYPRWTSLARFSTHDYQSSRSGTRTRLAYVLENT